ncbi:hypothetical protein MRS44_008542 [Fusarium solani]|uniref:uncharacterized protein n=1 Tax=Fusarium solani TaxID=169388 RepID=UPI0032C4A557|nr:hypothetical protein MRS44_008542 [Fusarium solani]
MSEDSGTSLVTPHTHRFHCRPMPAWSAKTSSCCFRILEARQLAPPITIPPSLVDAGIHPNAFSRHPLPFLHYFKLATRGRSRADVNHPRRAVNGRQQSIKTPAIPNTLLFDAVSLEVNSALIHRRHRYFLDSPLTSSSVPPPHTAFPLLFTWDLESAADVNPSDVATNNEVDFDYERRFGEYFTPIYCSLRKLTLEPSAGHAAEQDAMLPNVHVEEHGDDEWALPSSSADEDDPLAVEEEAVNAMDIGKSVARRPKGVSVARLRNTPAPALETATSLSMAVVFFRPPLKPEFGNAGSGISKVLYQSWIDQTKFFQILERTREAWQNDHEARHMAYHGALVKDIFGQDDCYSGIFRAFPDVDLSPALQIVLSWGSRTRRDSRGFVSSYMMKFSKGGRTGRSRSD